MATAKSILLSKIRHPGKRKLLVAFANTASVLRSAEIAGVDRDNHYFWLKNDPDYAEAFQMAWDMGVDALEAEASRRAFEGILKPVYHAGKRAIDVQVDKDGKIIRDVNGHAVGVPAAIREYSDALLMFLLRGKRPRTYRDNVSIDQRFVNKDGDDRPFLLSDADRLIADADAADAEGKTSA